MCKKRSVKFTRIFLTIVLIFTYSFCSDSSNTYQDGNYYGISRDQYIEEPYWGHIRINIAGGFFTKLDFMIRDSSAHEVFDSIYGVVHFSGYPDYYQQQLINDRHGVEEYPKHLLQSQNLDMVSAITGATWSYNIFMSSVRDALKNAKVTSSIHKNIKKESILIGLSNIFNSEQIEYLLCKQSYVKMEIYDSQGRFIEVLQDGNQRPGLHTIQWNNCLSSGVYFLIIQTDSKKVSRKIIISQK